MLYNIVIEQVSQWTVFHKLLKNYSAHMWSVILYVKCSFSLVWERNVENKCPQCGYEKENSKHLTQCMDPGCLLQLCQSIDMVMEVLNEARWKHTSQAKANALWKTAPDCDQILYRLPLQSITLDGTAWWKGEYHTFWSRQWNQCCGNIIPGAP